MMNKKEVSKEILTVILAIVILGLSVSFLNPELIGYTLLSFVIIIGTNFLVKKAVAFHYEADIRMKFWAWYQYGFKGRSHFKRPIPMAWLPLVLAPLGWKWLAILETEITAKTERVSKRHGLYRFSEMTEWHIALIIAAGLITNLILALIGYSFGFELFSKLSIYFSVWSIIPFSKWDGAKILFGGKILWASLTVIVLLILGWGIVIF